MRYKVVVLVVFIFISSIYADLPYKNNIDLFPDAMTGYKRYVIEVPHRGEEDIYKLELQIGKNIYSDCNKYRFEGDIEVKSLENNETYLRVTHIGKVKALTDQECRSGKKDKFVFLSIADDLWRKYDSMNPRVIYVPKEYEVRYRIWKAEKYRLKAVSR